jgi:hypothetical protein
MSNRAKNLMEKIWESRNSGVDTETKLVSQILKLSINYVTLYDTQTETKVLTVDDLVNLSNEVESLK